MFICLHVIRLYWNWHTCIPYALEHPRIIVHEMSLEKNGSEGSLKYKISEGSLNK